MKYYICAIIKDEQLYLKEWIDWHLSIGFNEIFLYEDFTSTSHKDITDLYNNVNLHSMSEIPLCVKNRCGRQIAVYNDFIKRNKEGWCLFIDIDEYLILDNGVTLESLTNEFSNDVGIEIRWKCYGANNFINKPDLGIQEAYSQDFKENWNPYWNFKSFINLEKTDMCNQYFVNCHFHNKVVTTEHQKGDFRKSRNNPSYKYCHINHYITKSWEEYLTRLKRGNITKGIRDIDYFFRVNKNMLPLKEELTKELDTSEFLTMKQ